MDIGGSLTKIAYYSSLPTKKIIYDGGGASVHYEVNTIYIFYFPKNIVFSPFKKVPLSDVFVNRYPKGHACTLSSSRRNISLVASSTSEKAS